MEKKFRDFFRRKHINNTPPAQIFFAPIPHTNPHQNPLPNPHRNPLLYPPIYVT